jgi:hypothetical protein
MATKYRPSSQQLAASETQVHTVGKKLVNECSPFVGVDQVISASSLLNRERGIANAARRKDFLHLLPKGDETYVDAKGNAKHDSKHRFEPEHQAGSRKQGTTGNLPSASPFNQDRELETIDKTTGKFVCLPLCPHVVTALSDFWERSQLRCH